MAPWLVPALGIALYAVLIVGITAASGVGKDQETSDNDQGGLP